MNARAAAMATLADAARLVPGCRIAGDPATAFARVWHDTRTLVPGDLYVALVGERFDGHEFLAQAAARGAVAALASHGLGPLPGLEVADTRLALQQFATGWRRGLSLPLVAVAGSNGKTTVTQMIAAILRAWLGEAAQATRGNFNNEIGVPLTLLSLRPTHRAAVVELGMNHEGEIARLARIAQPTVGVVNNAQREHQEFLAGVDAVARENGAVIEALPADGVAVFPAGDAQAPLWRALAGARRRIEFALDGENAVAGGGGAQVVDGSAQWDGDAWRLALCTPAGAAVVRLHAPGRHNAKNALAATAAALAAGAPLAAVVAGLEAFRPVAGRSAVARIERGGRLLTLVDDSYNANPDSVLAAIEMLAALPAPRWLVLGDMGEVGAAGPAFHAEVGARVRERGIEHFWSAGALAAHAGAERHFADAAALVAALDDAPPAASVLVKGSRFMAMERVVRALRAPGAATGGAR